MFDEFNNHKDFKLFCYKAAKEFKEYLLKKYPNSYQMAHRTITNVQEFFTWLKDKTGYKKIDSDDIKALQLSFKNQEIAKQTKPKDCLDALTCQEMILNIKPQNELELRGQAMLACLSWHSS